MLASYEPNGLYSKLAKNLQAIYARVARFMPRNRAFSTTEYTYQFSFLVLFSKKMEKVFVKFNRKIGFPVEDRFHNLP